MSRRIRMKKKLKNVYVKENHLKGHGSLVIYNTKK